jgi:hypothetical protein
MSVAYAWQKFYNAVVVQTDFQKLPLCIAEAERAIGQRLSDNPPPLTDSAEFDAIGKTLAALAVLKAQIAGQGHHAELGSDEELGGYVA